MRHLWSLVAGVVAAPLVWLLLATGQHRSQATLDRWDTAGEYNTAELIGPAILLVVAGVLLGVLGTLRWSPAGPMAAGALLILPTILVFANPFQVQDNLPDTWRLLAQDFSPRLPIENGTMLVLGALLLMAAFSIQRWRQWPVLPAPIPPPTDEQVITGMDELNATPAQTWEVPLESRRPLTDEEILAEAQALEGEQAATGTAPVPPEAAAPEPEREPEPTTEPAAEPSPESAEQEPRDEQERRAPG